MDKAASDLNGLQRRSELLHQKNDLQYQNFIHFVRHVVLWFTTRLMFSGRILQWHFQLFIIPQIGDCVKLIEGWIPCNVISSVPLLQLNDEMIRTETLNQCKAWSGSPWTAPQWAGAWPRPRVSMLHHSVELPGHISRSAQEMPDQTLRLHHVALLTYWTLWCLEKQRFTFKTDQLGPDLALYFNKEAQTLHLMIIITADMNNETRVPFRWRKG